MMLGLPALAHVGGETACLVLAFGVVALWIENMSGQWRALRDLSQHAGIPHNLSGSGGLRYRLLTSVGSVTDRRSGTKVTRPKTDARHFGAIKLQSAFAMALEAAIYCLARNLLQYIQDQSYALILVDSSCFWGAIGAPLFLYNLLSISRYSCQCTFELSVCRKSIRTDM